MSDDTASLPDGDLLAIDPHAYRMALALVIAWAEEEWWRVGEAFLFDTRGTTLSLGRGAESPARHVRATSVRQRPGINIPTPPLATSTLSRDDLLVTAHAGGLDVESAGKYPMRVNGERVARARLEPGALVHLEGGLLLRCVERQLTMPPALHFPETFLGPWGEASSLGIVGESPEMQHLLDALAFAAKLPTHVLLRGDTGTGKAAAAKVVHLLGPDAKGPFEAASVGNVPMSLLEDELFGHVKGYPDARMDARKGLIGLAHGGTLFLDEIADLPFDRQVSLLYVLDRGTYRQLGGSVEIESRFKLVGAMNREASALKVDLRKRLSTQVSIPSLAHRRDDIPLLVRHLLKLRHEQVKELTEFLVRPQTNGTSEPVPPVWFVEQLMRQDAFEGNVRDLIAAIDELLARQSRVMPGIGSEGAARPQPGPAVREDAEGDVARGASLTLGDVEWFLELSGGNVAKAARHAKVSRPAFHRAMKRLGVGRGHGR